jgi:Domain of Unknown Function (DUF1080)
MKRVRGRLAVLALVLATLTAVPQDLARAEKFELEPGFTSLYNGKDLSGWMYKGSKESLDGKTETSDERIVVKDGLIVMNEKDKAGKGGIKDLYTLNDYNKDFHLKLQFRAAPRADSGVYIRGKQLQVRDYPTVGPYKPKGFKDADWNDLDIVVKAGVVTTMVNGKVLSEKDKLVLTVKDGKPEAILNDKPIDINAISVSVGAVAECRCNGEILEKAFPVPAKGGIGLQAETGKFEFRHVRIKELGN